MSSPIERKNHRIHPCDNGRKMELLNFLISQHPQKKILVATSKKSATLDALASTNVTIVIDANMSSSEKNRYDILISYDLPDKAIIYMTRFAHAREIALILLGAEDQKHLYGIETLLGRTIIQEAISGFEPSFGIAVDNQHKAEAQARRAAREEEALEKASKWAKKEREKPKFLGKDANGKPIFEKKTRDRNHYIDGTPRSSEEKAAQSKFKSKPVFFGEDKKSSPKLESKEFKEKRDSSDKKGFGEKKPYGDKKPYGEKKAYGDKKPYGEKKPYDGKKSFDKKPAAKAEAAPARPPRRINVKSLKPKESAE